MPLEQLATRELGRPFVIRRRLPDGTMQPAPDAAEYFAISYVEPLAGNEPVLGYDITSAPSAPLLADTVALRTANTRGAPRELSLCPDPYGPAGSCSLGGLTR